MGLILYTLSDHQNTGPTGWPIFTMDGWPENGGLGRGGVAAQNTRIDPTTAYGRRSAESKKRPATAYTAKRVAASQRHYTTADWDGIITVVSNAAHAAEGKGKTVDVPQHHSINAVKNRTA